LLPAPGKFRFYEVNARAKVRPELKTQESLRASVQELSLKKYDFAPASSLGYLKKKS
jgi:hypothetical protein